MKQNKNKPLEMLRYHVSGAIERGEKSAIKAVLNPEYNKGPWRSVEYTTMTEIRDSNENKIAKTNKANGRLIASAPELLEALKQVNECFYSQYKDLSSNEIRVLKHVQDLIRKATEE